MFIRSDCGLNYRCDGVCYTPHAVTQAIRISIGDRRHHLGHCIATFFLLFYDYHRLRLKLC